MPFEVIKVEKAYELYRDDPSVVLLDVRREEERHGPCGRIDKAILIPLEELADRLAELEPYRDRPIVAVCYAGVRSKKACEMLDRAGFAKLYNVKGGMMEWEDHQYPVIPGQPTPDGPEG